jgi:transposase InsO family protein
MEEKLRFIFEYERDEQTMTELCQSFGIARETGYVWLRRYRQSGVEGLLELNRRAERHPNQTAAEIEQQVLELRQAHMRWGPRKLKRVLERDQAGRRWPAASTIGELLKREGLVVARRKRRKTAPYTEPLAHADGPNRVWCADFKGWFRTGDGERIDPLTISDAHSRYLLRCQAVAKTDTARVQAIFEAGFRQYGLPQAIRTDNGAPFASTAIAGLSRLAVWWIKLGIVPERIEAGHPEQNGRHERMHRTLKQEVAMPPAEDRRAQQRALEDFRQEYNEVRPHEALGMQTPASVYEPSERAYPAKVREPDYPSTMLVCSVHSHGHFRWKKRHDVFLSEVLWGERVGLLPIDERWYTVYFAELPLARFDSWQRRVLPLPPEKNPKAAKVAETASFYIAEAGEGEASPSPAPHPLTGIQEQEKVSGMSPV